MKVINSWEFFAPMNRLDYAPLIARERKELQYYKGILQKTDTGLHEQLVAYLEEAFPTKLRILDWGAGEGALAERLSDAGHSVLGVDLGSNSWKSRRAELVVLDFNDQAAVETFANRNKGAFDLVLAVEVIEHIRSPWPFLRNLHTFGCDVIITTPNISSWWSRFWFLLTGELWEFVQDTWHEPGHINPIGAVEMINMLRETGFEVRRVFPGGRLPVIWAYNWKRFLISILALALRPFMRGYKDGWALCFHARPQGRAANNVCDAS